MYKSLKGRTTLKPILKTSKAGKPWSEFALLKDDGAVVKVLAFGEVAEKLCSKIEDNCAITCLVTSRDDGAFTLNGFEAPKMASHKVINYRLAVPAETQVERLCKVLGGAYVTRRFREWVRGWPSLLDPGQKGSLTRVGKGFDLQGYKALVNELEQEINNVMGE